MWRVNSEITSKIRKSLKFLADSIETEPALWIDGKGKHWINDPAQEFIKKRGLSKEDFLEWLKIGASYLDRLKLGDIAVHMIRLPGEETIIFLRQTKEKSDSGQFRLTPKESEVLYYLVKGFSNKEIATVLDISPGTVNTHLDSIYSKLGCPNRVAACITALKNGLFLPMRR